MPLHAISLPFLLALILLPALILRLWMIYEFRTSGKILGHEYPRTSPEYKRFKRHTGQLSLVITLLGTILAVTVLVTECIRIVLLHDRAAIFNMVYWLLLVTIVTGFVTRRTYRLTQSPYTSQKSKASKPKKKNDDWLV